MAAQRVYIMHVLIVSSAVRVSLTEPTEKRENITESSRLFPGSVAHTNYLVQMVLNQKKYEIYQLQRINEAVIGHFELRLVRADRAHTMLLVPPSVMTSNEFFSRFEDVAKKHEISMFASAYEIIQKFGQRT